MYLAARQRWGGWHRVLGSGGAPQPAESTADRRPDSGGAPQPAESTADASQPGGLSTARLNLGCFNAGADQNMLTKDQHQRSLSRVIAKAVSQEDLHLVTLCEVGGHKQGLNETNVRAQDLISQVLLPYYQATSCQAYMATWQATDGPNDDHSVTLTLVGQPEVVELHSAQQPQLVIMVFTIDAAEHPDKQGLLISGQMHIRTPKAHAPTQRTRKRITKSAMVLLEEKAATASSGASQPTAPVIVLTGDVNIDRAVADSVVQPEIGEPSVGSQWQVMTSAAARSGDVLFVKGAFGEALNVSVGASYADRGIRNDSHDFFGVALSIPMSDKTQRGQKRQPAGGATQPASKEHRQDNPRSSGSGAPQPDARLPEDPNEKRVAKNKVAYTKAQFLAFYEPQERGEREWAAAPLAGRKGRRNALTGRVMPTAEAILEDMYEWYQSHVDEEEVALSTVFRHLQNTLFKNVTVELREDVWKHSDGGGASQPAAQGEARMVVSREYVANNVKTVIARREEFLRDQSLPMNTVLRDDLADQFLLAVKDDFHAHAYQRELQGNDAANGKNVQAGKHSRWSRHTQKLGGTPAMWTLLSFTGRFDPDYLDQAICRGAKVGPRMPSERTSEQKQQIIDAQEARSRLRRGAMLERLQARLTEGNQAKGTGKSKGKVCGALKGRNPVRALRPGQLKVLQEYRSGELRRQANKLTKMSGHGRLLREDLSYVDIGGSTGGFVRTVLDDWEPPDLGEFEE